MDLSIVVIFHDMAREAARTLASLAPAYQRDPAGAWEVIAIDNGSAVPLDSTAVHSLGPGFSNSRIETGSVSPAAAVNAGLARARGRLVAVIVDGARMASPGLVGQTIRAARLYDRPFVCAPSWHLGHEVQNLSITRGYNQAAEDRLLEGIGWPRDGYRLFEISVLAQSSAGGFLGGVPVECSWWAMRREDVAALGGFEPRFQCPGGGLVNHDFRNRAMALPGLRPVMLLGEGVFHQVHGGVATNVPMDRHPIAGFRAEYRAIRGRDYAPAPARDAALFGRLPPSARRFLGEPR